MRVEPGEGWAAAQAMAARLTRLGYVYTEHLVLGRRVFVLEAPPPVFEITAR